MPARQLSGRGGGCRQSAIEAFPRSSGKSHHLLAAASEITSADSRNDGVLGTGTSECLGPRNDAGRLRAIFGLVHGRHKASQPTFVRSAIEIAGGTDLRAN